MKIEDRLRRQLHDTAEQLIIRPDDYERVIRLGKRRRRMAVLSGAAASTMVVALSVVLLAWIRPDSAGPLGSSIASLPSPTTTVPTQADPQPGTWATTGLAIAGPQGVTIHDFGSGSTTVLESDPYYETVSWVVADGAGGLVFVHETTPLPWEQGSIMWLPAGANEPRPLIAPGSGELMVPLQMIDGTMTLLYRYDHRGGSELRLLDLTEPSTVPLLDLGPDFRAAAADGDVLAVVSGDTCLGVDFFLISGGGPVDVGFGNQCLPQIEAIGMAAGFLYTLEDSAAGRELVVRHLATGVVVGSIEAGDSWELAVAPDGTVAFGGEAVTVGRFSEGIFEELAEVPGVGTLALTGDLDIGPGARLGSGEGSLPCTPLGGNPPLAGQDLPPEVEATRQLLYTLASTCDLAELTEQATADGTVLGFGDAEDPLRLLIEGARRGYDVANWIVRILNTEPAPRADGGYAWPAVFVTGAEADWEAISGTLTAAEYEQLRQIGDYLGFRVGIDADGRWAFAVAGD